MSLSKTDMNILNSPSRKRGVGVAPTNARRRARAKEHRRMGFTLIEMLVATALAASVTVASLAVLTRFSRHVRRERGPDGSPEALMALLETDLLHAERLVADGAGVTLLGYGSIGDDGSLTHRPAHVSYEVRTVAGRSWLLRRQTVTDAMGRQIETCVPVCADVTKLSVAPAGEVSPPDAARTDAPRAIAAAVVVTVEFAQPGGMATAAFRGHVNDQHGLPGAGRPCHPPIWTRTLILR